MKDLLAAILSVYGTKGPALGMFDLPKILKLIVDKIL
jgi:hypothetical protein